MPTEDVNQTFAASQTVKNLLAGTDVESSDGGRGSMVQILGVLQNGDTKNDVELEIRFGERMIRPTVIVKLERVAGAGPLFPDNQLLSAWCPPNRRIKVSGTNTQAVRTPELDLTVSVDAI